MFGQFIKFSFVGLFNTLLDFFIYYSLSRWLGINFLIANAVAFICAATASYFLNRNITFKVKTVASIKEFGYYVLLGAITLIIVETFMYFGVDVYKFNDLLTKFLATLISVLLNFTFSKWVVFRKN